MDKSAFDPDVYEFYRSAIEGGGFSMPAGSFDLEELRADEISRHLAVFEPYGSGKKTDIMIPRAEAGEGNEIPARIYIPDAASETESPLPVMLYFHGGGFIMGSIEDHDPLCAKLADSSKSIVISVEYRLAPEYPFPACIEDAVTAAKWVSSHADEFGGDRQKIMAAGDSSGANISAVIALLSKEGDVPPLSGLILFYGTYGCVELKDSGSALLYGQGGYVLPLDSVNMMMDLYLPDGTDPDDTMLNPGRAEDLSGMPPAVIVSAEFDPLRDDSKAFAARLSEAGCRVEYICAKGMMHGFALYWQKFRKAEELLEQIGLIISEWQDS